MANNETRVIKTDTFEGWRQKSNEVSFELGDVDQLDSRILDKTYTYTASAGDALFTGTDTGSKTLRFEEAPETVTDMLHVVIFTGSPTIPSNFVAGATATQTGGFSGKILWINTNKAAFSTVSGTFNAGENLTVSGQSIAHANLVRTVSESVAVGYVRVKQGGTEQTQTQVQAGFHVPNLAYTITLTGSPAVLATFSEGATVYQGSVGSETFTGTILKTTTSNVYLKTYTGSFSASVMLKQSETSGDRILAANLSSGVSVDASYGTIVELHTLATGSQAILVISNDAVDAINEVQDDVGDITALGTTDKADVVTAVNELETGIRGSSSSLISAGLTTTGNDLLAAVNEHDAELGTISAAAMGTTASTVGPAILELETEIDVLNARVEPTQAFAGTFSSSTVMDALNEHEGDIGNMTLTGLAASDLSAGLREIRVDIGDVGNSGATLTTGTNIVATDLTAAVVELDSTLGTGVISGSGTEAVGAANITTAVNLLNTALGDSDSYNDGTYGANTVAGTLDLLQAGMIANDTEIADRLRLNLDTTTQTLTGTNRTIQIGDGTDAVTLDFANNAVLDISDGTLLVSAAGGIANFGSAFLNLDANLSTGMGLQVDRDHITQFGTMTNHDVRLQWNEAIAHNGSSLVNPEEAWQLIGMETDGTTNTTSIVTRYNAFNLIANNTESGINVTWDATNENFDFDVNDFSITLTGDVTGTATITNLANQNLITTIANNSVDLGAHTTGNYIATIAGTANEITVSGSGSETAAVTLALPDDVTIGNDLTVTDYTRTAGLRVATSGSDPGDGNAIISNDLTVGGDITITGNLDVNGTTTTLNTTSLEVDDTIILMGASNSYPSSGGFGIETRPFTGQTNPHANAAAGVAGTHSLVYNFATDRWEADGSLVLSEATLGTAEVAITNSSGTDLTGDGDMELSGTRRLHFREGTGIELDNGDVGITGNDIDIPITNSDRGSSQNIWKVITPTTGSGLSPSSYGGNNAALYFDAGTGITVTSSTPNSQAHFTWALADTGAGAATYGQTGSEDGQYIKSVVVNAKGQVTAVTADDFDDRYMDRSNNQTVNGIKTFTSTIVGSINGSSASCTGNAASASNAATLDGVDSSQFLRSDTADSFTGSLTMGTQNALVASDYGHGVHGLYNAGKYHHVWGRSTSNTMHASGNNLTGFYGLAWADAALNNKAGGNQLFVVQNGSITSALGTNIWTSGIISGIGSGITDLNGSEIDTGTVAAARIANLDASKITTGTLADARIPNLNTSKLTAGTLPASRGGTGLTSVSTLLNSNTTKSDVGLGNVDNTSVADIRSGTTKSDVGLGNVDNTSVADIRSGTTASNVGLGNVTNESKATMFTAPTFTGTVANFTVGTITGSITGNAGTVTNGVYTTGNQTIGGTKTFSSVCNFASSQSANAKWLNTDNNTQTRILFTVATSDGSGPIYHSGGLTVNSSSNIFYATDFVASSDERLKIKVGTLDNALDKICALDGFLYTWNDKAESEDKETVQVGISAQQVQEVLPEAVDEGDNGYLGVKYDKLVPLLIESIKELKSEVEELKSINSKDKG